MREKIKSSVKSSIKALEALLENKNLEFIEKASLKIASAFLRGNKIIIAGNGGSLCDASHFAEELTGFFRNKRKALPAIVLSEPGHLTCVSNDVGFEYVFSRGVEAFGKKGDIFIGLTTSGNSKNLINAINASKKLNMETIAFLGKSGGKMKGSCDLELLIEGFKTSDRVQEAHMSAIHIIIEIVEKRLFDDEASKLLKKMKREVCEF